MEYLVSGLEMAALDRQTIDDIGVPGPALLEVAGIGPKSAAKIWEQAVAVDSDGDTEPQAEDGPGPDATDEPQEPVATDI